MTPFYTVVVYRGTRLPHLQGKTHRSRARAQAEQRRMVNALSGYTDAAGNPLEVCILEHASKKFPWHGHDPV